jgi:hypothetical protein
VVQYVRYCRIQGLRIRRGGKQGEGRGGARRGGEGVGRNDGRRVKEGRVR